MKSFTFLLTSFALYASVSAVPARKWRGGFKHPNAAVAAVPTASAVAVAPAVPVVAAAAATASTSTALVRGASTVVLFEVGGIAGNECLTFRNNGEIVDAACVNEAADRQLTPSTIGSTPVLLVQRSFTAGFRPDLVDVDACVGFNGTVFLAQDCAAADFAPVSIVDGVLRSGDACQSGHDDKAQLTVDTTGATCADVTSTAVTATAP